MFKWYLGKAVRRGRMFLIESDGRTTRFGESGESPALTLRIHDRRTMRRLSINPDLALGEAYMDGTLTVENGTIRDVIGLLFDNMSDAIKLPQQTFERPFRPFLRRLHQYNPIKRAERNVSHHYDLSRRLYELFLDSDEQYSCAYFTDPSMSLEAAQDAKKRHIAAKLQLKPGMRVLDVGSGWGGLALTLAETMGVDVTGLTLSREQLAVANERARARGVSDRVRFHLRDYRLETGTYDRIVSVGMFEHVGINHYETFFSTLHRLLAPEGIALVHSIGRLDGPGKTNPWIRKYIFPGGYAPALSEVLPAVEQSGLLTTDIEILRMHYAMTIDHWQKRFQANRAEIAQLYDERFCRMWEFYLAGAEMDFRHLSAAVFQLQMAKSITAVPLTRDYIVDWEKQGTETAESRAA
ncbi:MAG: cyclopropane-fatty-acyl-phospholipid synthase [Rhodospirillales bacterium]|nr:cyclopropane-fatty-acyl-phospholipid synthase [Rhodospirillales bacterium]